MSLLRSYLESNNILGAADLDVAVRHQQSQGGSLDTALLELGLLTAAELDTHLARACGLPTVPARLLETGPERPWSLVPKALVDIGWAMPLAVEDGNVLVAVHPDLPDARLGQLYRQIRGFMPMVAPECCLAKLAAERSGGIVAPRHAMLLLDMLDALQAHAAAPGVPQPGPQARPAPPLAPPLDNSFHEPPADSAAATVMLPVPAPDAAESLSATIIRPAAADDPSSSGSYPITSGFSAASSGTFVAPHDSGSFPVSSSGSFPDLRSVGAQASRRGNLGPDTRAPIAHTPGDRRSAAPHRAATGDAPGEPTAPTAHRARPVSGPIPGFDETRSRRPAPVPADSQPGAARGPEPGPSRRLAETRPLPAAWETRGPVARTAALSDADPRGPAPSDSRPAPAPSDSLTRGPAPAPSDSLTRGPAPSDSHPAPAPSNSRPAPAPSDSLTRGPAPAPSDSLAPAASDSLTRGPAPAPSDSLTRGPAPAASDSLTRGLRDADPGTSLSAPVLHDPGRAARLAERMSPALAALAQARERDRITEAIVQAALHIAPRVVLFGVRREGLRALAAPGSALQLPTTLVIPIPEASLLERAVLGQIRLKLLTEPKLAAAVGRPLGIPCLFEPVFAQDRGVLMLYIDRDGGLFDSADHTAARELCDLARGSLEALLRLMGRGNSGRSPGAVVDSGLVHLPSGPSPTATRGTSEANPTATRGTSEANPAATRGTSEANPAATRGTSEANPAATRDTSDTNPTATRDTSEASPTATRDTSDTNPTATRDTSEANPAATRDTSEANPTAIGEPASDTRTRAAEPDPTPRAASPAAPDTHEPVPTARGAHKPEPTRPLTSDRARPEHRERPGRGSKRQVIALVNPIRRDSAPNASAGPSPAAPAPVPQDSSAAPVPQDSSAAPVPQDSSAAPVPQDSSAAAVSPTPPAASVLHVPNLLAPGARRGLGKKGERGRASAGNEGLVMPTDLRRPGAPASPTTLSMPTSLIAPAPLPGAKRRGSKTGLHPVPPRADEITLNMPRLVRPETTGEATPQTAADGPRGAAQAPTTTTPGTAATATLTAAAPTDPAAATANPSAAAETTREPDSTAASAETTREPDRTAASAAAETTREPDSAAASATVSAAPTAADPAPNDLSPATATPDASDLSPATATPDAAHDLSLGTATPDAAPDLSLGTATPDAAHDLSSGTAPAAPDAPAVDPAPAADRSPGTATHAADESAPRDLSSAPAATPDAPATPDLSSAPAAPDLSPAPAAPDLSSAPAPDATAPTPSADPASPQPASQRPTHPLPAAAPDIDAAIEAYLQSPGDPDALAALRSFPPEGLARLAARFPGPIDPGSASDVRSFPPPSAHGPLLRACVEIGPAITPYILDLVEHPRPQIRFYAAFLFQDLRDPRCMRPLAAHAFDPDPDVRLIATRVLESYSRVTGFIDATELVRAELKSRDRERALLASEAAGTLRDTRAVPVLIDLLSVRDKQLRETALESLCSITAKHHGYRPAKWKSWYAEHGQLSRIEWVLDALRHRDTAVRRWAADELVRITGHRIAPPPDGEKPTAKHLLQQWTAWWEAHASELGER